MTGNSATSNCAKIGTGEAGAPHGLLVEVARCHYDIPGGWSANRKLSSKTQGGVRSESSLRALVSRLEHYTIVKSLTIVYLMQVAGVAYDWTFPEAAIPTAKTCAALEGSRDHHRRI